jgi:hypothetical protein
MHQDRPHTFSAAIVPEPFRTRRIERFFAKIAEQGDGVALDVAAQAFCARFIIDAEPKKRHRPDDLTGHLLRVSQNTWDSLVTLGFVEEKREGEAANQRFLRLTEKGRRAADGGRY